MSAVTASNCSVIGHASLQLAANVPMEHSCVRNLYMLEVVCDAVLQHGSGVAVPAPVLGAFHSFLLAPWRA